MTIIASCGHDISDIEDQASTYCFSQSQSRAGRPALSYSAQCPACKADYEKWGILFHSEAEAQAWLDKESEASFKRRPADDYD